LILTFGLGLVPIATDSSAQFNPQGRKRPPKATPGKSKAGRSKRGTPNRAADPVARRKVLIARYTKAVLADPSAQLPIRRLVELYTAKAGNIDGLVDDFERRAAAGSWNARLALAGIFRDYGETGRAVAVYEAALAERPNDSTALIGIAELFAARGDLTSAREHWERAVPKLPRVEQESLLRRLRTAALEQADWNAATAYHGQLVAVAKNSPFVRAELGRELIDRGQHARAVVALEEAARAAQGDSRALAPALRDLGIALLHAGRWTDAEKTLVRAK
jgi:cellulose synthase operon protein C